MLKFKDAYNDYLEFVENRLKPQTLYSLKDKFSSNLLPYWGDFDIYSINDIDFIKWQNFVCSLNYSYNYKRNLHYLLSSFFEFCVNYKNLKYNFARKIGCFKRENKKFYHNFYSNKEFKKFIKYVDSEIYKQFFNLMFYTGTRPGEAMALKFSDIAYMQININKTISEHCINGKRCIDTPKSFTSFRTIVIDRKLYKDLFKLKKLYENKYNLKNYDYFVFGGIKPLAPTTINRYKINACNKANLKPIKLHEFRHSHASFLYDNKIPMQAIKERLGHSNINVTMGVYVHLLKRQEKKVLRTLNFRRFF